MKPVIVNSLLIECRRRSTTTAHGLAGFRRGGGGKRSFSSSAVKKHQNPNTTMDETKSQSIANAISYYSASWMSSLSERFTTNNEKFAKEFNRYYMGLNEALKSNRFTSSLASSKENNEVRSPNGIVLKNTQPEVLKQQPPPLSSPNPQQPQSLQSTAPPPMVTTSKVVSNEERLAKLCSSIEKASSLLIKSKLITDLYQLLYQDPEVCSIILRSHKTLLFQLVNIRAEAERKRDKMLSGHVNQCLALLGYVDPSVIKHKSLNILSLDGGGAKGFVAIEVMKNIEKHCQKPIHEIFDYICGVSTGAVLASLVGIFKLSLSECEREYKRFLKELFQRNKVAGLSSLIGNHSYYDTKVWETMLKDAMGEMLVINSAKDKSSPKISMVSCKTTPEMMKIYLFRNYNLPQSALSQYEGTARYKVWEAVRASTAAPVYYEDFKLDGCMYQDGGILANNPTFVALHEAKQLWPSIKDNYTVVSIGNGRRPNNEFGMSSSMAGSSATSGAASTAASISLRQKITRIVSGVADPESTHGMLADLLPPNKYFRFCPFMTEEYGLDENRPAKWQLMQYETNMYMRRNEMKFERAAQRLLKAKTPIQRFEDFLYNENYITNV